MSTYVKLAVFVPEGHADAMRLALGEAGAGRRGNYAFASFSSRGTFRFVPLPGAHPTVGEVGAVACVAEERIEVLVARAILRDVVAAMKAAHPYEDVAFDIFPLEDV